MHSNINFNEISFMKNIIFEVDENVQSSHVVFFNEIGYFSMTGCKCARSL